MSALSDAFHTQATACQNLGSPFMHRLLTLLGTTWHPGPALAEKCATFQGDIGPAGISLPLRIAGGLHAVKLNGDTSLDQIYPPNVPSDSDFAIGIAKALRDHDAFLADWINSPPQTNELRRSAALMAAACELHAQFPLPVHLSELGASGGLNLMWDQFALETSAWRIGRPDAAVVFTPDWDGTRPTGSLPSIAARRGVDLNPLDPTDPHDLLRLTAYLWPDQSYRLDMTRAAAGSVPAPVDAGDAIDWLEDRLAMAPMGHIHMIQNTIAWQYFPKSSQERGRALLEDYGTQATPDAPMVWVQLETDGDQHGLGGAALTMQIWPGGQIHSLGRADFHGRWVRWNL
ncbi:MAG: DUF2332 domain-containing protein [Paracoccaceae bacterium]